ncbi:MAG TPA: hypothetical protein PLQ54_16980 [Armatimonadota bacterium]|nr:hypothetical protein [Armatimonadota bacterium]
MRISSTLLSVIVAASCAMAVGPATALDLLGPGELAVVAGQMWCICGAEHKCICANYHDGCMAHPGGNCINDFINENSRVEHNKPYLTCRYGGVWSASCHDVSNVKCGWAEVYENYDCLGAVTIQWHWATGCGYP